jgi:hypothetical protein
MGGVVARAFSDMDSSVAEGIFPLFLAILLQYAVYLAWPEFLLLAYCKFRFKSFIISPPQNKKRKKKGAKTL